MDINEENIIYLTRNDESYHAEEALINNLELKDFTEEPYTVIIIRKTRTGLLSESHPCANCIDKLLHGRQKGYNIQDVYYSHLVKNNMQVVDRVIVKKSLDAIVESHYRHYSSGYYFKNLEAK